MYVRVKRVLYWREKEHFEEGKKKKRTKLSLTDNIFAVASREPIKLPQDYGCHSALRPWSILVNEETYRKSVTIRILGKAKL